MFTMQNNDSRLRKAARRTLRAEATLIIVIVLITTWSIYGLYKLSIGSSDTFMGLSFRASDQSFETRTALNNQASDGSTNDSTQLKINNPDIKQQRQQVVATQPSESTNQKLTYSQPNEANQLQNILQQLYSSSKSRDTNDLGTNQNNVRQVNSIEHLKSQLSDQKLNPNDYFKDLRRGYKLPSNLDDISDQDKIYRATDLLPHIYGNNHSNGVSKLPITFPSLMQLGAEAAKANKNLSRPKNEQIESKFPDVLPPDYGDEFNDKVIDDGSVYDRVPAESNRDSSESSIRSDDIENQTPSTYNYEENQPQQDTETTTTAQPNYEESEQSQAGENHDGNQNDSQSPSTISETANSDINDSDNEESSSKASNDDEANQQPDNESTKETSQSIDEEVDKMTQPTSGMVSQQDRPFDYKNTVQFDDSLPTSINDSISRQTNRRSINLRTLEPGNLIARFEDPNSDTGRLKEEISKQRDPSDLQVDHNTKATGIDTLNNFNRKEKGLKRVRYLEGESSRGSHQISSPYSRLNRQRRSIMEIEKIRAPYEVDKFLDSLNFDSLTGQSSSTDLIKREPKSLDLNSSDSRNSTTVDRYAYNSAADNNDPKQHDIIKQNFREPSKINKIDRRNFFDDDLDNNKTARKLAASHYYDPDPDIVNSPNSQYYRNNTPANNPSKVPDKSRYHYLTSNDTGIQELLDKKSLFNSLGSDELPPPAEKPEISPKRPRPLSNVSGNNNNQSSGKNDHQAEDSLFSVDHGLLLYPSADEEHHHKEKSISKKHKKSDKKKEKKKMTVAIKKGGHKKKKHKKEMKKFLKEKKFKGAKKGKKVAKGKGGQGGKKGKKLYKDKGFKKKGFKNVYHKEEFGQKKSYFDEYRDKDFKKKWKKFDDKYNYAQMKKWQAKDVKHAKKKKDHGEKHKKYDKGKWKKKYEKHSKEHSEKHMKKKKKSHKFK